MVLSIGEILVDIFKDKSGQTVFPGGAPFNVACNIAHFNGDVGFYGAVGKDQYGTFLKAFASKVSTLSGRTKFSIFVLKKALSPIDFKVFGKSISLISLHSAKAWLCISFSPSFNLTLDKRVQYSKAWYSIISTPSVSMDSRLLQKIKHSEGITLTDFGIVILTKPV